jgi:hypothetical protein
MNAATVLAAFRTVRGNAVPRAAADDPRSFTASDIKFRFSALSRHQFAVNFRPVIGATTSL